MPLVPIKARQGCFARRAVATLIGQDHPRGEVLLGPTMTIARASIRGMSRSAQTHSRYPHYISRMPTKSALLEGSESASRAARLMNLNDLLTRKRSTRVKCLCFDIALM